MRTVTPFEIIRQSSEQDKVCLSIYAHSMDDFPQLLAQARALARKSHDEMDALMLVSAAEHFRHVWSRMQSVTPVALFMSRDFSGYTPLPFASRNLAVMSRSFHVKPLIKWQQREKPFALVLLQRAMAQLYLSAAGDMKLLRQEGFQNLQGSAEILRKLASHILAELDDARLPIIISGEDSMVQTLKTHLGQRKIILDDRHYRRQKNQIFQLQESSLRLLEPYFRQQENRLIREYKLAKLARRTSSDLAAIVRYAILGQVEHLFINDRMHLWGKIDIQSGRFFYYNRQLDTIDDDVLDDLAEMVIQQGGQVTVLPSERMPDSFAAAAILKAPAVRHTELTTRMVYHRLQHQKSAIAT